MTSALSSFPTGVLAVLVAVMLGLLNMAAVSAYSTYPPNVDALAKLREEGFHQIPANAAVATIKIGDTLHFKYNNDINKLLEVTEPALRDCNSSAPLRTWTDGDTSITFLETGNFFYIWGIPGLCLTNQRLTVEVTEHSGLVLVQDSFQPIIHSHHKMLLEKGGPCNFDCPPDNSQQALQVSQFWILPILVLGSFFFQT